MTPTKATRRQLLQSGSLVLLLGVQQIARGAEILAVRVWPAKDYTRLTIESDSEIKARQFLIADPPRVAIDIEGIDLLPALRELVAKVKPDDPNIAGIRVGQNAPGVLRLVIDLKQAVLPQVFTLKPVAPYQHRLVFDLYPQKPLDPLEALIAERLKDQEAKTPSPAPNAQAASPPATANAAADPLGELIAGAARRTEKDPLSAGQTGSVRPPAKALTTDRLVIVALDPGHGGEDPGAIGPGGTREKDVVLQIAMQLRERINQQPNMRAYLTREADFFVPLHVRVQKARRVQADLFISIHADAFFSDRPQGASLKLGGAMLGEIGSIGKLHKPRVEQAGFAVLRAPDIPSVLVETAFISNPDEEVRLRNPVYQAQLSDALMRGILRYFAKNPPLARNRAI
jgi:N-acetylmuramoyl-L-alanine amidase